MELPDDVVEFLYLAYFELLYQEILEETKCHITALMRAALESGRAKIRRPELIKEFFAFLEEWKQEQLVEGEEVPEGIFRRVKVAPVPFGNLWLRTWYAQEKRRMPYG